ncbi:outer membrane beta-barrel protein [Devosia sp. ZB163]|uniref:outer membrane protein n=1 Tax=Devosia sp. ZB163 TaxID=3025938 RepID=UPI002360176B|nr:outer membrane beta-barrel protein [Devosia sp. ZB163]MDC9824600.1 outer membrane beta-barrel protein [Devosia sp. ZB163]
MSRRLLIVGIVLACGTGAGMASDLMSVPVQSSAVAIPVGGEGYNWNGFYAGLYGVVQSSAERDVETGVGVEAGVNAQFDFFLVGGEVALQGLTGDTIDTAYGQVTGRGGVLITNDLLAYASAGYGMELTGTGESDLLAGGGIEYAINDALSVNAEYTRSFSIEGDNDKNQFTLGARFHF